MINSHRVPAEIRELVMAGKRAAKAKASNTTTSDVLDPMLHFGVTCRDTWRSLARTMQQRLAREGIPIGVWFLLRALWEEEGGTQRELADRVGVNGATTVAALNSMERSGLVVRVRNQGDKRKVNVFLTKRGRALRERLWDHVPEVNALALKGLTSQEAGTLVRLLARARANLQEQK